MSGQANGNYKHGRYSKILPVRLQQTYELARRHPQLLRLTDDIATAEARLVDLFTRVDSGESGHLWQALAQALEAFNTAMSQGNTSAMHEHLATMRQLIGQGVSDYHAWSEIQRLWETRCKLTQTETKTLMTLHQMVTTEQLMVYFSVITDTIQRAVSTHADSTAAQAILGDIAAEFQRISMLEDTKAAS